jgi:protein O-GlcNAc transferase
MILKLFGRRLARDPQAGVADAERLIAEGREAEEQGRLNFACERYRAAAALAPLHPPAHLNLGVALEAAGDTEGARKSYATLLALDPGNAFAHYNLGKLHFLAHALAEAEQHLRAALERKPEFAEAQVVLANVLVVLKREDDAMRAFERAAALDPGNAQVRATLADLYQSRGDFSAAATHLEQAVRSRPAWSEGLFSYAHALMRLHRFDEAAIVLDRLVALAPDREQVHQARMDVLVRGGRVAKMIELCRQRQMRAPRRLEYGSMELFTLNFVDGISADEVFARHKAFGARLEGTVPARFAQFANTRDPGRRLRIGYVSGEFYLHPVARFMIPLIERHDRSAFEVYCYSVGALRDSLTRQVEKVADVWREAKGLTHEQLADLVHEDRIDILFDLSGHTGGSRLEVFAQRPAPVQATWLGNLNTTGLTRIQYRITDWNCDPAGLTERLHTEQLVRLPHSQWCYRSYVAIDPPPSAPLERSGRVTFGSFTQFPKLTTTMRALWARILRELPQARLVMAGVPEGGIRDELLGAFNDDGIDSSRITLLPFQSLHDYMRSFADIDIALDTSPYSGGTTTCDALWMGVPVLTMPGIRPASRSAAGILATIGLSEWIADSPDDYVSRAVKLGREREIIGNLHRTLRKRMLDSPLMQEAAFARDVEQTWRQLWRNWCSRA